MLSRALYQFSKIQKISRSNPYACQILRFKSNDLKKFNITKASNITKKTNVTKEDNATRKPKVTILGAGGCVGQSLSLLLKISPKIDTLKLYDIITVKGLSEDLSHINTPVRVYSYSGSGELSDSLKDSDIVVITAGQRRALGMSREDLFATNATIVRDLVEAVAVYSPTALIAILTNPLNSMVPVACKALQRLNKFDARKVFGINTIDIIRTITFLAEAMNLDPRAVNVPVVGGHSGTTCVPVLSRSSPPVTLNKTETEFLTIRIQEAGDHLLLSKAGTGTSSVGSAYAAARFVTSLCRGLSGEVGVVECAYVHSRVTDVGYFANDLELGKNGIEKNLGTGKLNEYEASLLETSKEKLRSMIMRGEQFGETQKSSE